MQRYQALTLVRAITCETYLSLHKTLHEAEYLDEPTEAPPPLEEGVLQSEWIQWRSSLIRQYHLEQLVGELNRDEHKSSEGP